MCSVRYRPPERRYLIDNGGLYADDVVNKPVFNPKETNDDDDDGENNDNSVEVGELKQQISLNLTSQTEEITVPSILNYKKATFVHDFIRVRAIVYIPIRK